MKHKINILGTIILFLALSFSCVDDTSQLFNVEKPESIAQKEYLNDYDALKTYISNSAGPNFKLGAGVTVSDYINEGLTYRAINSNFDRVTAGNAMKYGSVVGDDGSMNFGPVVQFVTAAKDAGTEIYGHTLLWHAQQNKKYLEKIIADKEIEVDPDATDEVIDGLTDYSVDAFTGWAADEVPVKPYVQNGVLVVENPSALEQNYFLQYHAANGISIKENTKHKVTIRIKGTTEGSITVALGTWGSQQNTQLPITEEWKDVTVELGSTINASDAFVMLQSGLYVGTYEIAWVKVSHEVAAAVTFYVNQLENSQMLTGGSMDNFVVREFGKDDVPGAILEGEGPDGMNAIKINSIADPANPWDTQFFIYTPGKAWEGGEEYRISFWYKASATANVESQAHGDPGAYMHYAMLPSNPQFTTEWKYYEAKSSIPAEGNGMKSIAFNLNANPNAISYYFANIVWETVESGNKIPLTPQEKADTLTYALETWIAGVMEATDGYVKAWDVVNEALIGEDKNGDGKYDLRSAEHANETELANDFYWGDYLGDEYVRLAVKYAREYGPSDIKLFVNDFNLESDWDDNQKLKSLIKWIEHWEDDGVTVIDGIGTQMHVSYYMNPDIQASKEAHVVKMFELMAATGKLVVVTELDMGLVDENGDKVLTVDATDEQLQAMSDYYKFIVQKYLEIIPASQQAGITHWCPTDSPADSSWRGGEPVGLWTERFSTRKHTYAGFADGLSGN
jgi:GH35 family endo-1,4-beta-xylanase